MAMCLIMFDMHTHTGTLFGTCTRWNELQGWGWAACKYPSKAVSLSLSASRPLTVSFSLSLSLSHTLGYRHSTLNFIEPQNTKLKRPLDKFHIFIARRVPLHLHTEWNSLHTHTHTRTCPLRSSGVGIRWLRGVPCQNNVQPGPAPSAAAPAYQLGQTLAQIKDLLQLIEFSSIETCWKFHRIVMTVEYPFKVL